MQKKIKTISTRDLAELLGITDRRIQQLSSETEKVFVKISRGKYDLVESVQNYIQYQVELIKNKQSTGTLLEEQTRLTKLKADKEEIELAVLRAEYFPRDICISTWQSILVAGKTTMLSIPSTIKTEFPMIEDHVIKRLDELIRNNLQEMSQDGIPSELRKRVERHARNVEPAADDDRE